MRITFAVAGAFLVSLAPSAVADDVAKGISQADCQARAGHMAKMIEDWNKSHPDKQVSQSSETFWKSLGLPADKTSETRLLQYVATEDGSSSKPALRTGREVALYKHIKAFISAHRPGETIGMDRLLGWALDDAAAAGEVNLQSVFLTVHNIERIIARPQQWSGDTVVGSRPGTNQVGHPRTDPMRPVLDDILGLSSVDDGPSLAQTMLVPRRPVAFGPTRPRGEVLRPLWSMGLYDPKGGVFQAQPGAVSDEWNGGSHYYFWLGTLARSTVGSGAILGGARGELAAKAAHGRKAQGEVEVSQFICGSMVASEVLKSKSSGEPNVGCGLGVQWQSMPGEFWVRRGKTNVFDVFLYFLQKVDKGQLTMRVDGDIVRMERRGTTDGNDCDFEGKLKYWPGNGETRWDGSYKCTKPWKPLGTVQPDNQWPQERKNVNALVECPKKPGE